MNDNLNMHSTISESMNAYVGRNILELIVVHDFCLIQSEQFF